MSSHFSRATGSARRTFRKSAGTLCTAPAEIVFLFMNFTLLRCRSIAHVNFYVGLGALVLGGSPAKYAAKFSLNNAPGRFSLSRATASSPFIPR